MGPRSSAGGLKGYVGEVPRGEMMLYAGTDPESSITEYTLVYEDQHTGLVVHIRQLWGWESAQPHQISRKNPPVDS